jgi:hypothetical protein
MCIAMLFVVFALCLCTLALYAQSGHVELGAFADYFSLSRTSPHINYVGVGARRL